MEKHEGNVVCGEYGCTVTVTLLNHVRIDYQLFTVCQLSSDCIKVS